MKSIEEYWLELKLKIIGALEKISGAQQSIKTLKEENKKLQEKYSRLNQENTSLKIEMANLRQQNSLLEQRLKDQNQKKEVISKEVSDYQNSLSRIIDKQKSQIKKLKEDLATTRSMLEQRVRYEDLPSNIKELLPTEISEKTISQKITGNKDHHGHQCREYLAFLSRIAKKEYVTEVRCIGVESHLKYPLVTHISNHEITLVIPCDGNGYKTLIKTTARELYQQVFITALILKSIKNK